MKDVKRWRMTKTLMTTMRMMNLLTWMTTGTMTSCLTMTRLILTIVRKAVHILPTMMLTTTCFQVVKSSRT